jgi:hypothetical protein
MPLAQRVCKSTLSGGLGELGPQNGGRGASPRLLRSSPATNVRNAGFPGLPVIFVLWIVLIRGGGSQSPRGAGAGGSPPARFFTEDEICVDGSR